MPTNDLRTQFASFGLLVFLAAGLTYFISAYPLQIFETPSLSQVTQVILLGVLLGIPIALFTKWMEPEQEWLVSLNLGAHLFRIGLLCVVVFIFQGGDEITLHHGILNASKDMLLDFKIGGDGHHLLTRAIYAVFGPSLLVARLPNLLVSTLGSVFAFQIATKLAPENALCARFASWAVLFCPPLLLVSVSNLKDMMSGFFFLLAAWVFTVPQKWVAQLLGGAFLFLLSWQYRGAGWALPVVAGAASMVLFALLQSRRYGKSIRWAVPVVLFAGVGLIFFMETALADYFKYRTFETRRGRILFETSSSLLGSLLNSENPFSIRSIALYMGRGVFSPVPLVYLEAFQNGGLYEKWNSVWGIIASGSWYALVYLGMKGLTRLRGLRTAAVCFSILFAAYVFIMVGGAYATTDYARHKLTLFPLGLVLASASLLPQRFSWERWVTGGFVVLCFLANLGWLFLKLRTIL